MGPSGDEGRSVHEQVIARFAQACGADDRIVAVFVGGSVARGEADEHSDVDLCLVAADGAVNEVYADRAAIAACLGTPLFAEDWGDRNPEMFVILDDGTDVELVFTSESRVQELEVGPIRPVLDRSGFLDDLVLPIREPAAEDLAGELRGLLAWFWHEVSHFIKAVGRGQLWWAAGEIEALRAQCVNVARIEQGVASSDEPYFKVDAEAWTEPLEPLRSTFVPLDAEAMVRAATELLTFFGAHGRAAADAYGISYPSELEDVMRARLYGLRPTDRGQSMDRDELLAREDESWRSFQDAFSSVPPDRRTVDGVVPGWSTHDLVWHCAYWTGYAGEVIERIRGGEPEPPDSDLTEEEILADGRAKTWDAILRHAENSRERVRTAFAALNEPTPKAIESFRDETFDHYDEHAAQIRAFSATNQD
jgi:predicted nucleotidyltransferase